MEPDRKRPKTGGRQSGTPNRVTADLRQALKQLADGNAASVQGWLDRVAATDPADALRLWLALIRFVTPTLQATSLTELTRPQSVQTQLYAMSDEELMAIVRRGQRPAALIECKPERDPILA